MTSASRCRGRLPQEFVERYPDLKGLVCGACCPRPARSRASLIFLPVVGPHPHRWPPASKTRYPRSGRRLTPILVTPFSGRVPQARTAGQRVNRPAHVLPPRHHIQVEHGPPRRDCRIERLLGFVRRARRTHPRRFAIRCTCVSTQMFSTARGGPGSAPGSPSSGRRPAASAVPPSSSGPVRRSASAA